MSKSKTSPKRTTRPSRDAALIGKVVDLYYDGLFNANVATLRKAFHRTAIVSGYIGDEPFVVKPVQFLYDFVKQSPSPARNGDPFRCEVRAMEIAAMAATVTLAESDYLGDDYVTYLQLLKMPPPKRKGSPSTPGWMIVSKLFMGTPSA